MDFQSRVRSCPLMESKAKSLIGGRTSGRLQRSIERSVVASVAQSERQLEDEGMSVMDGLPFVASGAVALGALGLAAAAASFATTTGTMLVIIPATTISWPLFAALGQGR